MRKICAALLLSLICAVGLAGKKYPKPPRNQTPKKKPNHLYLVFTRDETTGEKRFGFMDNTGRLVIGFDRLPKETFGVGEFHDGRALILTRNKTSSTGHRERTGYIDETGAVVIPAIFYVGLSFSEGLAHVVGDGFRGYVDRSGQIAIKLNDDDDESGDFHEGLAAVGNRKHWGYIDRSGRTVIKREYEFAGDFSEGLAAVVVDQKLGFIDKRGEMKIPPRFEPRRGQHGEMLGTTFSEGLAPVSTELTYRLQGTYGYINKKGEFVIKPQFQTARVFSEGLAFAVGREGSTVKKVGWIDKSGAWVLTTVKDCISDLVKLDHNGYMDWRYREGLTTFCDYSGAERLWGYMDRTGRVVIEPQRFNWAGPFIGGIAQVFNGAKSASPNYAHTDDYGYIDRTGKFIWESSRSKATGR